MSLKTFVLILTAVVLFISPRNVSAHEKDNGELIVHMGSTGFSPQTIEIKRGAKVIFENVDANDHWPASDDHPSHTIYSGTDLEEHCSDKKMPSFDACREIKSGETWSFVFDKAGTFEYHDHLWPQFHGVIKVGEINDARSQKVSYVSVIIRKIKLFFFNFLSFFNKEGEAGELLYTGKTANSMYSDLKKKYENIVLETDPGNAINILQNESGENNEVLSFCHDLLHNIGRTGYIKYENFQDAIKYQNDFCNSGYIHGVFESYLTENVDHLEGLQKVCDGPSLGRPFDIWQCNHGIGHGLMYLTGGDLSRSLGLCGTLLRSSNVETCQNGVYMEVFNNEVLAKENDFVDRNDPFRTCFNASVDKNDCYLYLPTFLSQTLEIDFTDILSECDKSEPAMRSVCLEGVGSEVMKRNYKDTPAVFRFCDLAKNISDSKSCVSGAAGVYVFQNASYEKGLQMCETAPDKYKETCKKSVSNYANFF